MLFYTLKQDDQLLVESLTQRRVINGPGLFFVNPLLNTVKRRKGTVIDNRHYAIITHRLTGQKRIERGPQLLFIGAEEAVVTTASAVTLKEGEYLHVRNAITGIERVESGPQLFFPGVDDETTDKAQAGPTLRENDYLHVNDKATGVQRMIIGPQRFIPGVNDDVLRTLTALPLKKDQYVRILDRQTGAIRIERGEKRVFLNPNDNFLKAPAGMGEENLEALHNAVKIDENTAVLVRDKASGQLMLITERGVFFPAADQEIVDIRQRISLEDHQVMVTKDKTGKHQVRRGTDAERSFFLAPYEEVVPFVWSTGIHKDKRALRLEALDIRPKFMWYEFEARTQDNVELTLGITFFWQIVEVEAMISTTDDATGDICSHARSSIIQAVSQVTLEYFLGNFNNVVRGVVVESHDIFYTERGVVLNAVEVRSIACKDQQTQDILMEIIQETTNRLNRLQKQESENEVRLRQIQGDTEVEQSRSSLIVLQRENELNIAVASGQAEASRVAAFLDGLGDGIAIEDKIAVYNLLRKGEVLHDLSRGSAQLYFTPADVNLSIESKR